MKSRKAFQKWLEEQPPRKIIGERRSLNKCPLAIFLNCSVDECGYGKVLGFAPFRSLPLWAYSFVKIIDEDSTFDSIQTRTCLRVLEKIT